MTAWRERARGEAAVGDPSPLPPAMEAAAARMGPADRAALAAAHAALASPAAEGLPRDRLLLWVAAEDGSAAADREFWRGAAAEGGRYASPALFAATLPSFLAGDLAIALGLTGPVLVQAGRGARDAYPPTGVADALRAAGAVDGVLAVLPAREGDGVAGVAVALLLRPGGEG